VSGARSGGATRERARAARDRARRWLRARGVEAALGLAREGDAYVIKASLPAPLPAGVAPPAEFDGVPLRLETTGAVRARAGRRR
jgi:hypothetical protein